MAARKCKGRRKMRAETVIYGWREVRTPVADLLNSVGFARVLADFIDYAQQYRDDDLLPPPEAERAAVDRMLAALAEARTHACIVEDLFASDVDSKH